ncbi:MAG: SET domain-containing protein-lysine N-methyltransferase [Parachlamydiaceae bacterium]
MLITKLSDHRSELFFKFCPPFITTFLVALSFFQPLPAIEKSSTSDHQLVSNIIYADIPSGIEIRETRYGYGVFASKPFKNGQIIYINQFIEVDDHEQEYTLKTEQGDFLLNTTTHAVGIGNGKRALYTFDSMMNHSCHPNSYSENGSDFDGENAFLQIACRDIAAGEEITCNYLLFEYDCSDKAITNCLCLSTDCLHEIRGFKWLSFEQQLKLLPKIDQSVLDRYLADHPEIIYIQDIKTPSSIQIKEDDNGFSLTATQSFKKGEIVYENKTLYFDQDKQILLFLRDSIIKIVNGVHTVNRGNGRREFFYFDSFMNHSCDPNTLTLYLSPTHYQGIALKDIHVGEELTCDYMVFDDQADESESFECCCGASNCRKIID